MKGWWEGVNIMMPSFKENDGNDDGEKQYKKNKVEKKGWGIQYLNWKVSPVRLVPSQ